MDIDDTDSLLSAYTNDLENLDEADTNDVISQEDPSSSVPPSSSLETEEIPEDYQSFSIDDFEDEPLESDEVIFHDDSEDSQSFSINDFGDELSSFDEEKSIEDLINLNNLALPDDDFSDEEDSSFSLEEDEFIRLQETINSFPQNLRLIIEQFLSDDRWKSETIKDFVDAILVGESPKALVKRYYNITKRRIILPRRYKNFSGEFF